jgi:hypothetical protein
MKMSKSDSVPSPSSSGAVMASVDDIEKAAGDDDADAGSEPDDDADDKDIKKSVWGGAFGPTYQSSIGIVKN